MGKKKSVFFFVGPVIDLSLLEFSLSMCLEQSVGVVFEGLCYRETQRIVFKKGSGQNLYRTYLTTLDSSNHFTLPVSSYLFMAEVKNSTSQRFEIRLIYCN